MLMIHLRWCGVVRTLMVTKKRRFPSTGTPLPPSMRRECRQSHSAAIYSSERNLMELNHRDGRGRGRGHTNSQPDKTQRRYTQRERLVAVYVGEHLFIILEYYVLLYICTSCNLFLPILVNNHLRSVNC